MKKIDMVATDGTSINYNQFLMAFSRKRNVDAYVIDAKGKIIFSTKENKCCWCGELDVTHGIICDMCKELARAEEYNHMVALRYIDNDPVIIIKQEEMLDGTEDMKEEFFKSGKTAMVIYATG